MQAIKWSPEDPTPVDTPVALDPCGLGGGMDPTLAPSERTRIGSSLHPVGALSGRQLPARGTRWLAIEP